MIGRIEKLDIYDEYINFLGSENRDVVHQKGHWHKTVHCWLYDEEGNVYFQIRADSNKLYTTASGHVLAGETIKQAFKREVFEEIGVNASSDDAQLVEINVWKMDKMKNGEAFVDRAFANVYINKISKDYVGFKFDCEEVLGVVKIKAKDCLELLLGNINDVDAKKITNDGTEDMIVNIDDFLIFKNELGILKYGKILSAIIAKNKN